MGSMSKYIVLLTLILPLVTIQSGCNSREKKGTESAEAGSLDSSRKRNKPKDIKLMSQLYK